MDFGQNFNGSDASDELQTLPGLISDSVFWKVMGVVLGLDVIIGCFATGANIVTIIVYCKMGFADSTTISLTALAISDFLVAATAVNCGLSFILPQVPNAWFTNGIFMSFAGAPHFALTKTSAVITTYLSVERYLCVLFPLKIRMMFTRFRTLVAMLIIFVITLGPTSIVILNYPMGWMFYPERNRTLLGVLPVNDAILIAAHAVTRFYFSILLTLLTFFTVTITTVLLAVSLKKSKAWRDANRSMAPTHIGHKNGDAPLSTSEPDTKQSKETKAVKMVIAIATLFIGTNIPFSIFVVSTAVVPGFDVGGQYDKIYSVMAIVCVMINGINSGGNIFIYYNMSSKFRHAMLCLFRGKKIRIGFL